MRSFLLAAAAVVCLLHAPAAQAQLRARAAREAAEVLFERFGVKVGRNVPELTARIESMAARHGDELVLTAIRKGGPQALGLLESAGADGVKVARVLTQFGEQGATRVLSKPTAMKQFLQFGDEAATVLIRHPGVAEPMLERGGAQAVKALGAIEARSGRRLAMLLDGELANAGRHPELLELVSKHGDRAVNFLWENKAVLAGGAALAFVLANPEPYLNGTRDIAATVGESVVKPVTNGIFTLLNIAMVGIGLLLLALVGLFYKYGLPRVEQVATLCALIKK